MTHAITMSSVGKSLRVMTSPSEMAPMMAENDEKNTTTSSMNAMRRLPSQM